MQEQFSLVTEIEKKTYFAPYLNKDMKTFQIYLHCVHKWKINLRTKN